MLQLMRRLSLRLLEDLLRQWVALKRTLSLLRKLL